LSVRSTPPRRRPDSRLALAIFGAIALVAACSGPPAPPASAGASALPTIAGTEPVSTPAESGPIPSAAASQSTGPTGPGRIVFVRFQPAVNHYSLFSVDPDGSNLEALLPGYAIGFSVPRWSWQGDRVAAQSGERCATCREDQDPLGYGFETIVLNPPPSHFHIHLAPSPVSVSCAAWSPDASLLACEGWSTTKAGLEGVYTVSATDGGVLKRLTTSTGGIRDIPGDYSADGTRLAFVRASYAVLGLGQIWMANSDGSNAHKVTDTLTTYRISWSKDGRWIVGERDGVLEVFDLTNLTKDPLRITIPGGRATEPRVSPDGSRIVFVFTKTGSKTSSLESVGIDGSKIVQITSGEIDRSPDWGTPGF
jgi:hypothetical protein